MAQVMRAVIHLRSGGAQGEVRTQKRPGLVCVVRADFPEKVACKPEPEQWIEVSQERGELVERKD